MITNFKIFESFKISADYWEKLKPFEQEYIKQRVHSGKDNISGCKEIISQARKQFPEYIKIWGKGFIELPDGETRVYSGSDSKKFHKIINDQIVFEAREDGDYWGNIGAGVLPICTTTGRILLAHRSDYVYEPNTFNVWGGKIDEEDGETENDVKDVAKREFIEETEFQGKIKLIDSYIFRDRDVFSYYNFIGLIDDEFVPKLNWETKDFIWVSLKEFLQIEPKHFGLKELIIHDLNTIKKYAK